jgi:hypothetical protein
MSFQRILRQTCLWAFYGAALCSLAACVGECSGNPTYWQMTSHDDTTSPTSGDIFGGFN